MSNEEYWESRFVAMENSRYSDCLELYKQIEELITRNIKLLSDKIETFVARFSDNNNVSITEARKLLNRKELEEFKMDVQEYIRKGKENAYTGEFTKQLENVSNRVHISRLDALKIDCQYIIESMYGQTLDKLDTFIKATYESEMYHTAYEIAKGTEIGVSFAKVNRKKLEKVVNKAWSSDGINFSQRIWRRSAYMTKQVENELVRVCCTGQNANTAAKHLTRFCKEQGKAATRNAKTLILTENSYFSSLARKDSFEQLDVEEFQLSATLDTRTSTICQNMDRKHFPMSEYKIGATAPPFHPRCRTVTIPYFEDLEGTRIAKDKDGNTIHVDRNMTYKEWYDKFIKEVVE